MIFFFEKKTKPPPPPEYQNGPCLSPKQDEARRAEENMLSHLLQILYKGQIR